MILMYLCMQRRNAMKRDNHELWRKALLYVELWLIGMVLWYLFYGLIEPDDRTAYSLDDFISDSLSMIVFLSVSFLFNKLFMRVIRPLQNYKGQMVLYSVLLLSANLLVAFLMMKTTTLYWGALPRQEFYQSVYILCMIATFVSSVQANVSFQQLYRHQSEERLKLEQENARQKEVNLQTSLMALKTQVDPHFLFNNFSILSELISESPKEAHGFLDNLSHVYRYKLVNMNTDLVSLSDELHMLHDYVHLIETRFGSAIQVQFPNDAVLEPVLKQQLPPLSIQLLVENAIKHNAHSMAHPLIVNLSNNNLYVIVSNPIQPLSSTVESTHLGLNNLKSRYQLLSNEQPSIFNDGKNFTVKLPFIHIVN